MYLITLLQNLQNQTPSALSVIYTFPAGPTIWPVTPVGPDKDRNVLAVNCAHNLINQPGVMARVLRAHYPVAPHQVDYPISSVQQEASRAEVDVRQRQAGAEPRKIKEAQVKTFTVNIAMDQDTVVALTDGGYRLYGFKAVESAAKGSPLVWMKSNIFSLNTEVTWQEQFFAYTSRSEIKPGVKITTAATYAIDLDQTLKVTDASGTGTVDTTGGVDGTISIQNTVPVQFSCGVAQPDPNGAAIPMCAFNLYGLQLDVIAPVEQVMFMFAIDQINTGTVIEKAFSSGLKIDLIGAPDNKRVVSFEINNGWSWDGGPWGLMVPAGASLVPLLIQNTPALHTARIQALHAA
jgi:hypothetical protein